MVFSELNALVESADTVEEAFRAKNAKAGGARVGSEAGLNYEVCYAVQHSVEVEVRVGKIFAGGEIYKALVHFRASVFNKIVGDGDVGVEKEQIATVGLARSGVATDSRHPAFDETHPV
jgi:hypothetical protein